MKKKIIISIIFAIVLILSIGVIMAYNNSEESVMKKMKKFTQAQVVEEMNSSNLQSKISIKDSNIQENVKKYMKDNELIENEEENINIKLITNNLSGEKYYRMASSGAIIETIKDTGELRTYINAKPTNFVEGTTYDKEKTEQVAKEIMMTNELLTNYRNAKFIEVKENTSYYPSAWFEDTKNNKQIFIILNPESREIMVIGTKAIPISENNEVKIEEATAKKIAIKLLNKTEEDIISVEQKEVVPNQMFLEPGYFYSDMNIKRNVYIVSFNTEFKTQVYIDATTGEVVGGNEIW